MEEILMSDSSKLCQKKGPWPDLGTRSITAGRTEENHKNIYYGV
jgi:hypothetical protein